jgi:hypothetical protein
MLRGSKTIQAKTAITNALNRQKIQKSRIETMIRKKVSSNPTPSMATQNSQGSAKARKHANRR